MSKQTVLLIGDLAHTNEEWKAYASKYNLKEYQQGNREDFLQKLRDGEYSDVAGLYRSNNSVSVRILSQPSTKPLRGCSAGYWTV